MALKHAENFIREIAKSNDLRKSLYKYSSSAEIMDAIKELGYEFALPDFEESINHLKTESPNEEQAIMLDELLMWWNMLMQDGTIVETESEECTPAKCSTCGFC